MPTEAIYRAVQVVSRGQLEFTEKLLADSPAREVRIRVGACGVCYFDTGTVEGTLALSRPTVPGHEAIGRIEKLGADVEGWNQFG